MQFILLYQSKCYCYCSYCAKCPFMLKVANLRTSDFKKALKSLVLALPLSLVFLGEVRSIRGRSGPPLNSTTKLLPRIGTPLLTCTQYQRLLDPHFLYGQGQLNGEVVRPLPELQNVLLLLHACPCLFGRQLEEPVSLPCYRQLSQVYTKGGQSCGRVRVTFPQSDLPMTCPM